MNFVISTNIYSKLHARKRLHYSIRHFYFHFHGCYNRQQSLRNLRLHVFNTNSKLSYNSCSYKNKSEKKKHYHEKWKKYQQNNMFAISTLFFVEKSSFKVGIVAANMFVLIYYGIHE